MNTGRRRRWWAVACARGQHEGVRDVAVVVREGEGGEKRLVAYVVAEKGREGAGAGAGVGVGAGIGIKELQEFLQQRLPEYMVPSGYVWMEELPLTGNGKVD